jgi:hypothetical protein
MAARSPINRVVGVLLAAGAVIFILLLAGVGSGVIAR